MNVSPLRSYQQRSAQNKHIVLQLHRAHCAVEKLAQTGFTVLGVDVSRSKPEIEIQYWQGCSALNGVSHIRRHGSGQSETVMRTQISNCEVFWTQPDYV